MDFTVLEPGTNRVENVLIMTDVFTKYVCMYVCITFISDSAIQNNIVIQCWGP